MMTGGSLDRHNHGRAMGIAQPLYRCCSTLEVFHGVLWVRVSNYLTTILWMQGTGESDRKNSGGTPVRSV
eukprot:3998676-Amphidinium_carterae.2